MEDLINLPDTGNAKSDTPPPPALANRILNELNSFQSPQALKLSENPKASANGNVLPGGALDELRSARDRFAPEPAAISSSNPAGDSAQSKSGDGQRNESIVFSSPFQRLRFGEKIEIQRSQEEISDAVFINPALSESLKTTLRQKINEIPDSVGLTFDYKREFLNGLYGFAKRSDISNEEKAQTYEEIVRILEPDKGQVFNSAERTQLTTQLLWHLSNVEKNSQGANKTCNVTDIRGIMLYESPAKFSAFIRELLETGKFVTQDNSVISLPLESTKVKENSEESKFPPADGERTWLGKISDLAMANVFWQRQTKQPDETRVRKGEILYREDLGDARLFRNRGGKLEALSDGRRDLAISPAVSDRNIAEIHQQITGESRENLVLTSDRREVTSGPGVRGVDEPELHEILSRERGVHIARIWTGAYWVKIGSALESGEHVVLIKDYDPATKTLAVDNSWSRDFVSIR